MPLEPSDDRHRAQLVIRPAVCSRHRATLKVRPLGGSRCPGNVIVAASPGTAWLVSGLRAPVSPGAGSTSPRSRERPGRALSVSPVNSRAANPVVEVMVTIGGLPAHPLIVHAVVVLLPLAAVGTLAVAARPTWRRNLGVPVFLIALVGVVAVPLAVQTGEQLQGLLGGGGPLVEVHEQRADHLLPYAILFLVLLLATLLLGRLADRTEAAGQLRARVRLTTSAGVLAAVAGLVVTGLVVWIGDAGATAVWSGVGG